MKAGPRAAGLVSATSWLRAPMWTSPSWAPASSAWRRRAIAAERPDLHLAVFDKEPGIARHQTGHNSGVIHAGLYYRPGSLKARLTLSGRAELIELCREARVRHEICGKVVVATRSDELAQLDVLAERAAANGVAVERLGGWP